MIEADRVGEYIRGLYRDLPDSRRISQDASSLIVFACPELTSVIMPLGDGVLLSVKS